MQIFDLENINWQEVSPDGTCYTLLEGDKQDPIGGFSYLLKMPPGTWNRSHWHTGLARLLVLRGSLQLGLGDRLSRSHSLGSQQPYVGVPGFLIEDEL